MTEQERTNLVNNIVGHLKNAKRSIQVHYSVCVPVCLC